MLSYAAMIRMANLDNMEPRIVKEYGVTWDSNKLDVWFDISPNYPVLDRPKKIIVTKRAL